MKRLLSLVLGAIALVAAGCSADLLTPVEIGFRDPQSRASVQEVRLWALEPSPGACAELLPGWIEPESQEVMAELAAPISLLDAVPRFSVPKGEFVLFCEASPPSNGKVLRACQLTAEPKEPEGAMRLELDWVCTWSDGTCLPPSIGTPDLTTCQTDADCVHQAACKQGSCRDGQCQVVARPDGTSCDDGQICTARDACRQGVCQGESYACDDSDPCTADSCQGDGSCEHRALTGASCDDGDRCTTQDTCQQGRCSAGPIDRDDDRDGAVDATCQGGTDCNDHDGNIRPANAENLQNGLSCVDGVDNDCDGQIDQQQPSCLLFDPACTYRIVNLSLGDGVALAGKKVDETSGDALMEPVSDSFEQSWKITYWRANVYRLTNQELGAGLSLAYDRNRKMVSMGLSAEQKIQGWKFTRIRDGIYRLTCQGTGDQQSLEVHSDDARLYLGPNRKQNTQYWKVIPLGLCPRGEPLSLLDGKDPLGLDDEATILP